VKGFKLSRRKHSHHLCEFKTFTSTDTSWLHSSFVTKDRVVIYCLRV